MLSTNDEVRLRQATTAVAVLGRPVVHSFSLDWKAVDVAPSCFCFVVVIVVVFSAGLQGADSQTGRV